MGALVNFHGRHKLLLLAWNEMRYRHCGQIVANHAALPVAMVFAEYGAELGLILDSPLGKNGIINAPYHAYGWMAALLPAPERTRLLQALERYRAREVTLAQVCSLLTAQARRCNCRLVLDQYLLKVGS